MRFSKLALFGILCTFSTEFVSASPANVRVESPVDRVNNFTKSNGSLSIFVKGEPILVKASVDAGGKITISLPATDKNGTRDETLLLTSFSELSSSHNFYVENAKPGWSSSYFHYRSMLTLELLIKNITYKPELIKEFFMSADDVANLKSALEVFRKEK